MKLNDRIKKIIAEYEDICDCWNTCDCSEIRESKCLKELKSVINDDYVAAMREASDIATHLWKKHYKRDSPVFELCDTLSGIMTQIDHMTCELESEKSVLRQQAKRNLDKLTKARASINAYRETLEFDVEGCLTTNS